MEWESEWGELQGTVMAHALILLALMGEISYILALRGGELPLMDLAGSSRTNTARGKVHLKSEETWEHCWVVGMVQN
jgi:hypothetical protein